LYFPPSWSSSTIHSRTPHCRLFFFAPPLFISIFGDTICQSTFSELYRSTFRVTTITFIERCQFPIVVIPLLCDSISKFKNQERFCA
jgi:hypothetical protein